MIKKVNIAAGATGYAASTVLNHTVSVAGHAVAGSLLGSFGFALPLVGPSLSAVAILSEILNEQLKKANDRPLSEKEQMDLIEWQVRLAKEFAISRRIDTAEKVTIEEFYEAKGAGNASASIDPAKKAAKAELGGNGERVTKRTYSFEGVRDLTPKEEAQMKEFLERMGFLNKEKPTEETE